MSHEIIDGDCRAVMARMEPESVTAIVTDPPYGLSDGSGKAGFMGHAWDAKVPGVEFWTAALRVLKPGGMLLAFGGTRTWHRLACAIEDAGFEIRDNLVRFWCFGVGFPKSHQFGCKCRADALPYGNEKDVSMRHVREARDQISESNTSAGGDILQSPLQRSEAGAGLGEAWPQGVGGGVTGVKATRCGQDARGEQPGMEGRGDILPEARELQADQICPLPAGPDCNGAEGRLRDGTPPDNGADARPSASAGGGGSPCQSQSAGQQAGKLGTVPGQPDAQIGRGEAEKVCEKCGGLIEWRGYGTALKPAYEGILCAMKPLDGTFAGNALKHGVAGLNIDGTRIPTDMPRVTAQATGENGEATSIAMGSRTTKDAPPTTLGRWPANLLLDRGAAELLDEMAPNAGGGSELKMVKRDRPSTFNSSRGGVPAIDSFGDSGGASRFFYTSKASRREREAGLEPPENGGRACGHPTVKPLDLMRWLCRLVKMPKGTVILDPFAGSGTTGCAAVLEGVDFIGVELNPEYAKIARARIAHWERNGAPPDLPKRNPAEMPGTPLFGDL